MVYLKLRVNSAGCVSNAEWTSEHLINQFGKQVYKYHMVYNSWNDNSPYILMVNDAYK